MGGAREEARVGGAVARRRVQGVTSSPCPPRHHHHPVLEGPGCQSKGPFKSPKTLWGVARGAVEG